jgi:hypothetical protein
MPRGFWSDCPGNGCGAGGALFVQTKYATTRMTRIITAMETLPRVSLKSNMIL